MFQKKLPFLLIFLVLPLLSACGPSAKNYVPEVLPEGLKDCKFYELVTNNTRLQVVRCPNSQVSTTSKEGKATRTTVTIDGEVYEKKE